MATKPGNASSWKYWLAQHLKGKRVVVMPDEDEAGQRYLADVARSLVDLGIEHRVVTFDGVNDVADYLANGGNEEAIVQRIGED